MAYEVGGIERSIPTSRSEIRKASVINIPRQSRGILTAKKYTLLLGNHGTDTGIRKDFQ